MTLFDIANPEDSLIDDDLSKQELIDKENIEAFKPLVVRFCEMNDMCFEMLSDSEMSVYDGSTEIRVWLPFLRLQNVATGELRSIHSSTLEPELYSMLRPGQPLHEYFFDVFPPFVFIPKMD